MSSPVKIGDQVRIVGADGIIGYVTEDYRHDTPSMDAVLITYGPGRDIVVGTDAVRPVGKCVHAEDLRAGDLLLPSGDKLESVEVIAVGPDWIVAGWVEGADDYGMGQPTLTWGLDTEVYITRPSG